MGVDKYGEHHLPRWLDRIATVGRFLAWLAMAYVVMMIILLLLASHDATTVAP